MMQTTSFETRPARLIRNSLRATLAVCALLCLPATAFAGGVTEPLEAPVVVGNQVFHGRSLELAPAGVGNLQRVLVDGVAVATVFRHTMDRVPQGVEPELVFVPEERGWRLIGVQWVDPASGRVEQRHFRVAMVRHGDGSGTTVSEDIASATARARVRR